MDSRIVQSVDLGLIDYLDAFSAQEAAHAEVVNSSESGVVFFLEHNNVLTLGKSSNPEFVQSAHEKTSFPLIKSDRGGEVTAHLPGQLVMYPIFPIQKWGISPKKFVCFLEETIIRCLSDFGVEAKRDPLNPGVWVGSEKVCALGVRVKNRVTMHGIAINISCDLKIFSLIVPCGIQGRGVTRLNDLVEKPISLADVKEKLKQHLGVIFSLEFREQGSSSFLKG